MPFSVLTGSNPFYLKEDEDGPSLARFRDEIDNHDEDSYPSSHDSMTKMFLDAHDSIKDVDHGAHAEEMDMHKFATGDWHYARVVPHEAGTHKIHYMKAADRGPQHHFAHEDRANYLHSFGFQKSVDAHRKARDVHDDFRGDLQYHGDLEREYEGGENEGSPKNNYKKETITATVAKYLTRQENKAQRASFDAHRIEKEEQEDHHRSFIKYHSLSQDHHETQYKQASKAGNTELADIHQQAYTLHKKAQKLHGKAFDHIHSLEYNFNKRHKSFTQSLKASHKAALTSQNIPRPDKPNYSKPTNRTTYKSN